MKLYLMDMDEATKHESSRIQSHPASPSWPFRMPVIGMSRSGKTNILGNLFLGTKAECICKGKKGPKSSDGVGQRPSRIGRTGTVRDIVPISVSHSVPTNSLRWDSVPSKCRLFRTSQTV